MKSRNVLLVDDDAALIAGLARALRRENYNVLSAGSALRALEILSGLAVDVVISDHEMPGMTGTEFLKLVRNKYPQTMAIMLTGKADLDVAMQAINEGEIYRLFTKPCNDIDLALAIREALNQRELVARCRKLVDLTQRQSEYIRDLERENPGLMATQRAANGAILVSNTVSVEEALREVTAELERAEQRLGRKQ